MSESSLVVSERKGNDIQNAVGRKEGCPLLKILRPQRKGNEGGSQEKRSGEMRREPENHK